MHDAVLLFNPDDEVVFDVNDHACDMYRIDRRDFIGLSLRSISKNVQHGIAQLSKTLSAREYHSFESVQFRGDGTEMALEIHASAVDYWGRPAVLSINRDVTERMAMLRRLTNVAAEWQLTVDTIDAAILLLDSSLRVIRANEKAVALSPGRDRKELIGRRIAAIGDRDPWLRIAQLAESALLARMPMTAQTSTNHGLRAWDLSAMPAPGADGQDHVVIVLKDISDLLDLQASLRRTERLAEIGQLVAGVAHEARNPLFAISASFEVLQLHFPSTEASVQRHIGNLQREIQRLSVLMQDLLDYGKPPDLNIRTESLQDVIRDAIAMSSAVEKRVVIVECFPAEEVRVLIDRGRVERAFANLIDNAIHHSPRDGDVTVTLSVERYNDRVWARCAIEDVGPGFMLEDMTKIFEPFFSRRVGGTGLGLSIVQRTVESHGGSVWAENRKEGGARFVVQLPSAG